MIEALGIIFAVFLIGWLVTLVSWLAAKIETYFQDRSPRKWLNRNLK